jgi:DNA-binding response OmpR family regulator
MLLVDDNQTIQFTVSKYLSVQGYDVDCAQSLEEVNALLAKGCPKVLIVDLSLSGPTNSNGLEIVTCVREQCPGTRVVVLTAYGTAEMEIEAHRCGVDAFIHKPLPLPELEKIVSNLIDSRF